MYLIPFVKEIAAFIVLVVIFDIWRKTNDKRLLLCTLLLFILFGLQTFNIGVMMNRYATTGSLMRLEPTQPEK